MPPSKLLGRAATYIRMSTAEQACSPEQQRAGIADYARRFCLEIVGEYFDGGKSGLTIKGRPALRRLLADALSGAADFASVLVYDVSRWGRFQDVDESAHYEYICRSAGIEVIYCAEPFENDQSPLASLLKGIKRAMAAEYSRELSAKVFASQCKLVKMGFKQGGSAGYGLRRAVVSSDGQVKRILEFGERKGATQDRVTYVLGPDYEVKIVRQVYSWYVEDRAGETEIAARLNAACIPSEFSRNWTPWLVHSLLTNEKFVGNHVFNRGSCKLKQASIRNPPDQWIRRNAAFEAPVTQELYDRARYERIRRAKKLSSEELLQLIRDVHAKHGKVTAGLLATASTSTLPKLLARHFGSMTTAYELSGIPSDDQYRHVETRRIVRSTRSTMLSHILELSVRAGGTAAQGRQHADLTINGSLRVHVAVSRSRHDPARYIRWKINLPAEADFVVAAQLDPKNQQVENYYLLRPGDFETASITLRGERPDEFARFRFRSLPALFGLAT